MSISDIKIWVDAHGEYQKRGIWVVKENVGRRIHVLGIWAATAIASFTWLTGFILQQQRAHVSQGEENNNKKVAQEPPLSPPPFLNLSRPGAQDLPRMAAPAFTCLPWSQ